ncbi:aspartate/glutamate racemase family protein [Microbacterium sp.]|uniref:aspartate/glutamate racemase family protein n=1 Tax=Microbacterium sp. TaxID=51671 RepID=UPI003C1F6BB9
MDYVDQPVLEMLKPFARPTTELSVSNLGPRANQLPWPPWPADADRDLAIVAAKQAEAEGMDAIVVACCADPHVKDMRANVKIPVVGLMETAVKASSALGKLSIFPRLLDDSWKIPDHRNWGVWEERAQAYGMSEGDYTLRSIRVPQHPDPETFKRLAAEDPTKLYEVMIGSMASAFATGGPEQAQSATEEDGATYGWPACQYFTTALIENEDAFKGLRMKVVNPLVAGLTYAEHLLVSTA